MERSFFQAAVVSILLYGCTTWTLTKQLEKSWRQHPTRHQLYGLPSWKLSKFEETDTDGETGTSSLVMYSYRPPHMAGQKQNDQLEHTYSSYVRIRDVALRTCQRRGTIGRSSKRGSGISMPAERHTVFKYETKKSTTWLIVELLVVTWIPCILRHTIFTHRLGEEEMDLNLSKVH